MRALRFVFVLCVVLGLGAAVGCQRAYYDAMEAMGTEKREILVDRTEDLRDALYAVRSEYSVAVERLATIVQPDALDAEQRFSQAEVLVDACRERSDTLQSALEQTDDIANTLFEDWIVMTREQADAGMRDASQKRLDDLRTSYRAMMRPARSAADRVLPVLRTFEAHVQHLKLHMDDASAATVRAELDRVQPDVTALMGQLEEAVQGTNSFLHTMSRQMHQQRTE